MTITFRLRADAAIYQPAPPRPPVGQRRRGRPRKWGDKLPSLAEIAQDPATRWEKQTVCRYGKEETLELCAIDCLWEPLGSDTPCRVVLIKDETKPNGYQLALLTTDRDSNAAEIVERYAQRWPIEVAFEEGKVLFGIGDARNRAKRAVERTVPFQFIAMTLTIVWYALHGHHPEDVAEHRTLRPWYLSKSAPSFADMLAKLRRVIIACQFHPGQGHAPEPAQIAQVQQAWAAAGL